MHWDPTDWREPAALFNYVGEFKFPLPKTGFPCGSGGKNLSIMQETQVQFLGQEDPLEKGLATHSSTLAGEFHGQRSLADFSPCGHKESDTTEWLSTHTHLRFFFNLKYAFHLKFIILPVFSLWHLSCFTYCDLILFYLKTNKQKTLQLPWVF